MKMQDLNHHSPEESTTLIIGRRSSFLRATDKRKDSKNSQIFALPQSILEKSGSTPWSQAPKKKIAKYENQVEKELGEMGRQYENILKKNIFNQTKSYLKNKRQKSLLGKRKLATLEVSTLSSISRRSSLAFNSNHSDSKDTLQILQKYIIRNPQTLILNEEVTIELESKRLPIIKKDYKKTRVEPSYHPKYKWEPQPKPTREEILARIAEGEKKQVLRPEIRGWDLEEPF